MPLQHDHVYVGFDSDTLNYKVPAGAAVRVFRPDGSELYRHPAKAESWHLTYRGVMTPGVHKIELNTP